MANNTGRLDSLLVGCGEIAARRLGHGDAWDKGLGSVCRAAVKAAGVPQESMTVEQMAERLGIPPVFVDIARDMRILPPKGGE